MYDLTIGIPTYNRADKLKQALKTVVDEIERYKKKRKQRFQFQIIVQQMIPKKLLWS